MSKRARLETALARTTPKMRFDAQRGDRDLAVHLLRSLDVDVRTTRTGLDDEILAERSTAYLVEYALCMAGDVQAPADEQPTLDEIMTWRTR